MPKINLNNRNLSREINKRYLDVMYFLMREKVVNSIKEFCDRTGAEAPQIHHMQKGKRYPTLEMVASLCTVMGISETYIIRGEGPIINEHTILQRIIKLEKIVASLDYTRGLHKNGKPTKSKIITH